MQIFIEKMISRILPAHVHAGVMIPEHERFGHYTTAVALRLAKEEKKNPLEVAAHIRKALLAHAPKGFFEKIEVVAPGFVNMWLSRVAIEKEFKKKLKEGVPRTHKKQAGTIIVEYSQPNIAKKMHVGHLRTTVLGDALANLYALLGHRVIRWNYYGDWGTQFGKLIAAYKLWGDRARVKANPIEELLALYVKFHDEMKRDATLEIRGREEFQKLESGDKANRALWMWFRKESLKEFSRTYKTLGVKFDVALGESAFEKDMAPLVRELVKKKIAHASEDSLIIPLDVAGLPPALVQKSDGASLYLTRDIASLRYRVKKYHPKKILYVVGNEQTLHFAQLFAVASMLGLGKHTKLMHVKYGLVLSEGGKKFATREGRAVFLDEVLEEAIARAERIVAEKNPTLSRAAQKKVAHAVAVGALKYANLKEFRTSDIVFNWEAMLNFSGDSAPYLQYTYARIQGILRKVKVSGRADISLLREEKDLALMRMLFGYEDALHECVAHYSMNPLATYLYELASQLNHFYETTPIGKDEDKARRTARLVVLQYAAKVISQGLDVLGIEAPEKI